MSYSRKLFLVLFVACVLQETKAFESEENLQSNVNDSQRDIKELSELIKDFEIANKAARKVDKKRMRKLDRDIRNLQVESMTGTFLQLNKLLEDIAYCQEFIALKGIERTIIPALDFPDDDVKADALLILRTVFETIPEQARNEMPDGMLEKVIDTFKKVGSFPVKRRTLDIISTWLPNNPTMQGKIIEMGGIEIFYDQLVNMDSDGVDTMLNMFISILEEHLQALKDVGPRTEKELEQANDYKTIGLLHHISSKKICNGVAELLENVWVDREIHIPLICHLLKLMKPFCLRKLKGKHDSLQNFDEIEKFVENDSNKNFFENVTETKLMIKAYKKVMGGKHTEL